MPHDVGPRLPEHHQCMRGDLGWHSRLDRAADPHVDDQLGATGRLLDHRDDLPGQGLRLLGGSLRGEDRGTDVADRLVELVHGAVQLRLRRRGHLAGEVLRRHAGGEQPLDDLVVQVAGRGRAPSPPRRGGQRREPVAVQRDRCPPKRRASASASWRAPSDCSEPSTPTTTSAACSVAGGRTTATGQRACAATCAETGPTSRPAKPPVPRAPTTIIPAESDIPAGRRPAVPEGGGDPQAGDLHPDGVDGVVDHPLRWSSAPRPRRREAAAARPALRAGAVRPGRSGPSAPADQPTAGRGWDRRRVRWVGSGPEPFPTRRRWRR